MNTKGTKILRTCPIYSAALYQNQYYWLLSKKVSNHHKREEFGLQLKIFPNRQKNFIYAARLCSTQQQHSNIKLNRAKGFDSPLFGKKLSFWLENHKVQQKCARTMFLSHVVNLHRRSRIIFFGLRFTAKLI